MIELNGEMLEGKEESIARHALGLNLDIYFSANFISVNTKAGKWQIIMQDEDTFRKLEHQNYRSARSRARTSGRGQIGDYHEHKLRNNSVYNALDYIALHDNKLIKKYN